MKVIIVGAGEVGSYLCEVLSQQGCDVTLIESFDSVADEIEESFDVRVIRGNGASAKYLKRANVSACDIFLAMTAHDQLNIVACALAHNMGAKNTVARVHDEVYSDNSVVNYQEYFNIDAILNPEALTAVDLAKSIRNPERVILEDFARGQIEVLHMQTTSGAKALGKPLKDLNLPSDIRICYVQRGKEVEIAGADTVLEPGDRITMVGSPERIFEKKRLFSSEDYGGAVRIAIYGATETAVSLVRLLSNTRFKVRIIDPNLHRCKELAESFPNITVINGSATSLRLLEEEQVGSADYFIACTKDDEENIMTSLQAKKLGVKKVQLVINKPDYEQVLRSISGFLDIQVALSPRKATATEILKYISDKKYITVGALEGTEIVHIEVKVPASSLCCGKAIKEMGLPRGMIVAARMCKSGIAKVPGASDIISAGDRLMVILKKSDIGNFLGILG